MKIKSITDVITNSSSETFIISYPNVSTNDLQELLMGWKKSLLEEDRCSGNAGEIKVISLEDWMKEDSLHSTRKECYISRIPWIPDSLVVSIDYALTSTIRQFKEKYPEAYNIEEVIFYPIYDEKGEELIRLTSDYQEWKSLDDPLRMHGEWAVSEMDWWNYEDKE